MDPSVIELVLQKEKEALMDISEIQKRAVVNTSEISKKNISQKGDTRDFDWRYLVVDNPIFDEGVIKSNIDKAIAKYKETFKGTSINFTYMYNAYSANIKGKETKFFIIKVEDPRFTCLLRGMNPDGTERCFYVKKEEEKEEELDFDLDLELDLDDLDDILDEDEINEIQVKKKTSKEKKSWGKTKTDEEIKDELKASATKVTLPPIFEIPRFLPSKEEIKILNDSGKSHLIAADLTVSLKFSRGFIDDTKAYYLSGKIPNVLFVCHRFAYPEDKIRSFFKNFASDKTTEYVMKVGREEKSITFPYIERKGDRNMYLVVFDPQTQDAKFASMFCRNLVIDKQRIDASLCDRVPKGQTRENIYIGATFINKKAKDSYVEDKKRMENGKIPHSKSDSFSSNSNGRGRREQVRKTR